MVSPTARKTIFITGILGYLDEDSLKKFNIGKKTLKALIKDKVIFKDKIIFNNHTVYIHSLTSTGTNLFKKLFPLYDIGRSCSPVHDYIHSKNVLSFVSDINVLHSYKNEKYIRQKYKEKIKAVELSECIVISCPDCSIIVGGRTIFIETLISKSKDKLINKNNFMKVVDDDCELIIF